MEPPVRVTRATRERLPVVADVLGRAFADDPMIQWPLFDGGSVATITEMFQLLYTAPVDLGMVWEGGDAEGVAVWVPPGANASLWASDRAVRAAYEPLTPDGGARYREMWEWIESTVEDDVWYLDALAVDPHRQRSGIGRALVELGLELAKASGNAAFLETSRAENVPYYERFGFAVVTEGGSPGGGPHIWFMRWEP